MRKEYSMRKKGAVKKLLVFVLIIVMLAGNALTVLAEDISENDIISSDQTDSGENRPEVKEESSASGNSASLDS